MDFMGEDDFLQDILDSLKDPTSSSFDVKEEGGRRKGSQPSKKRKFNPDAEKIAAVTEEALRQLDIDPNSQDAKKKRRQIRNRLSAQFHRDRKNAYIKNLEEVSEAKDKQIQSLQEQLKQLEAQNAQLKEQLFYYQSSVGGVTTSATSDSEQSICTTPLASESPLYQPADNSHLASMKEIVPARVNPTIPMPIVKTLSLLSVLCVICMSSLSYLEPQAGHQIYSENSFHQMERMNNHRRKLQHLDSVDAMDEILALPPMNDSLIAAPYLRGTRDEHFKQVNETAVLSPRMVFSSKDLIPFDLPYGYQKDWYMNNDQYKSMQYSKIMMNSGVALFDPSMKFSNRLQTGAKDSNELAIVPTFAQQSHSNQPSRDVIPIKYTKELPLHEHQADEENKNWPAITAPVVGHYYPDQDGARGASDFDCSKCSLKQTQDENYLLGRLLSEANHVTVTVPATSVRMGKSVQDSEDGTMESLMEMFNLSLDDDKNNNQTFTKPVLHNTLLSDASVEINCIILSAKLIMNGQKPH